MAKNSNNHFQILNRREILSTLNFKIYNFFRRFDGSSKPKFKNNLSILFGLLFFTSLVYIYIYILIRSF